MRNRRGAFGRNGMSLIDWEADWAGTPAAMAAGLALAALVALIAFGIIRRNAQLRMAEE